MKLLRVESCFVRMTALRHLRAAYEASVTPGGPGPGRRPDFDQASGADHERNARSCVQAAAVTEPGVPALDAPLRALLPVAAELAEEIEEASEYYAGRREQLDAFAEGRARHEKLMRSFAAMDEPTRALGTALADWHRTRASSATPADEDRRAADAAQAAARALLLELTAPSRPSATPLERRAKPHVAALEAATARSPARPDGPWGTKWAAALRHVATTARGAASAPAGREQDAALAFVLAFVRLLEVRRTALAAAALEATPAPP